MQYVAVVVAFSIGKPFHKPMSNNTAFIINVAFVAVYTLHVILIPDAGNKKIFGVKVSINSS
jgi:hypothetical protein